MKTANRKILAVLAALSVMTAAGCTDGAPASSSEGEKASSQAGSSSENPSSSSSSSAAVSLDIDTEIDDEDLDPGYDEANAVYVEFSGSSAEISGGGAAAENGTVTVSQAGTYVFSGTADEGRIIVDADKDDQVRLVFNGVDLTCTDNSPVFVRQADKAYIILAEGTENSVCDGAEYALGDEDSTTDGAIFSKADLTINGGGALNVTANYKHGIVSKDDLVITDGVFSITSASTAAEGKDSVKISGGTFDITAGTNGVRSTNAEDAEKGFISVTGGTFNITSGGDGFDAETVLEIKDGTFDITTGGGSENASMNSDGTVNENWRSDMGKGGMSREMGYGKPAAGGLAPAAYTETEPAFEEASADSSEDTSAKAFKGGAITVSGGTINIDSADDSFHSNGDMYITGGTVNASSGDDGIHADGNLEISGGDLTFEKSYEGIEGLTVTISGGNIHVTSSDDGINCAGGSDTGSEARMGRDEFSSAEGVFLKIAGGTIFVNAEGDGLDSNGSMYIEGGEVYVSGPTNSGNGAIDCNGTAEVSGGIIAACGAASGMSQGLSGTSEQSSVMYNMSSSVQGGSEVKISDESGNTLIAFTPEKNWQSIVFSCPGMQQGDVCTITAGSLTDTVEVGSQSASGSMGMNGGMGMNKGGMRF